MTAWHQDDSGWRRLSLAEQFGNVGSEISRAIRWSAKNQEQSQSALYRGLELFDMMLDDPQHLGSSARQCRSTSTTLRWRRDARESRWR